MSFHFSHSSFLNKSREGHFIGHNSYQNDSRELYSLFANISTSIQRKFRKHKVGQRFWFDFRNRSKL